MNVLRRFLLVGAVVTAIDVAGVLALAQMTTWPLAVVDALAITAATVASYVLHRLISYGNEPARRWYRDTLHYLLAVVVAGAVDVGAFWAVTRAAGDRGVADLIGPKVLALVAAFAVRLFSYREVMFRRVRTDQERPRARPPAPGELRLSLVIPAYFEAEAIGATIASIDAALGHLRDDGGFEVVVVDDGSGDDTAGAARRAGADQVLRLEQNSGKGAAVRAGMLAARGRTIAFTDADLSYSPDQVLGLLDGIEAGWDVVVGSRKHTETRTLVQARRLREIGGRVVNAFTSAVLLGQYRDTQCGLKAFRSDVATLIFGRARITGFAFDVEVFHLIERFRLTLLEVPVELTNSTRSTVHVVRDTSRLVRDLFRIRRIGHSGGYEVGPDELPVTLAPAGAE